MRVEVRLPLNLARQLRGEAAREQISIGAVASRLLARGLIEDIRSQIGATEECDQVMSRIKKDGS